jgi:RNA-binding protein
MATLDSARRRALRAEAHHLEPVVAIGQQGLTPAVLHEIDVALLAHELVKVRVHSESRDAREAMLAEIAGALDCAPVQHLGKLLILWRANPDKPPAAPERREAAPAGARPKPAAHSGPGAPGGTAAGRRRLDRDRQGPAGAAPGYLSRRGAGRFIAATSPKPPQRRRGRG